MRRLSCLFALAAMATVTASAQSWVTTPGGALPNDAIATQYFPYLATKAATGVSYGSSSSEVGDVWIPNYNGHTPPGHPVPAVVVVHGGGGTSGTRTETRSTQTSQLLAAHGYVAFNVDYALGAVYPKDITDWRLAVRWLRANAATYNIDTNHIGLTGGSFGGFAAAFMSGITNGQRTIWPDSNAKYNNISLDTDGQGNPSVFSGNVQCVFDLYGPTDQNTSGNAGGIYTSPTSTTLSNSSPVYYLHAGSAPVLIAHGTSDGTVNITQSQELTNYLGRFNVPYTFDRIPGAGHTFCIYDTTKGGTWPAGGTSGTIDLRKGTMDFFDTWLLQASSPPVITIQPLSQSGCVGYSAGFSVTASGTSPLAYQWAGPAGAISGATNPSYTIGSLAAGNAGNYSVVVTNGFGSVTSSVVTLSVNTATPPNITSQPTNFVVVAGAAASFSVAATGDSLNYQWYGPSGLITGATNAAYSIASSANTDAGSYSVVVFNSCNSQTSSNSTLTVNGPPSIVDQPVNLTTCDGTSATLLASASGTAPLSYQWYDPTGAPIIGAVSNSVTLNGLTTANSGNYYLVVTNAYGSATSSNALLSVSSNLTLTVTSQPTNVEVGVGAMATFSVGVSGGGSYTYLWLKNDADAITNTTATNATLVFTNISAGDAAFYHCYINNDCSTVGSADATLTVDVAPTITVQPQSQTNNVNTTVTLSVTASGTAPLTYQWQTNGVNLSGSTNSTLVFNSITSANAGNYDVIVANAFGSVTSAVATLTVNLSTTNTVTASSFASVQAGTNSGTAINVFSAGYVKVKYTTVTNTGTGMAKGYFLFNLSGQNADGNSAATLTIPTVSNSGATHIQVWGLNQPYPGMGTNITWLTAQANDTNGNGLLTTGSYTGATIGANTPCGGSGANGVITLPAPWGQFIQNNQLVLVLSPANATGDSANGYRVSVTNPPTLTFSTAVGNTPPTIASQPQSLTTCSGSPTSFSVTAGGAPPLAYQWQFGGSNISSAANSTATNATLTINTPGPANNGSYDVVITNAYGAVTSAVVSLSVSSDPPINITAQPTNTAALIGTSASFSVVATGGTLSYQWYLGSSPVAGGTNATLNLSGLSAGSAGNYSVLINNSCGSAVSQTAVLTVLTPPAISAQPLSLSNVLAGSSASFSVTAAGSAPLGYQWRNGGAPINGATSSVYTLASVVTNNSGSTFDVVVTNAYGSVTSTIANLTVIAPSPSTGLPASSFATIRDGVNTNVDIDEQSVGYVMVKYSTTGASAKGYFQFDLTAYNPNTSQPATFTIVGFANSSAQNMTLWALNQPYPGMNNSIVWNTAQANDTVADDMLTGGALTATALTNLSLAAGALTTAVPLPANWGQFVQGNKLTLVLTANAAGGVANGTAGFRVAVTNPATMPSLTFTAGPITNQFLPGYYSGLGLFGGFNMILTNSAQLKIYTWYSANPSTSVTNWTLANGTSMAEQPLNDGSGNSRYAINLNPVSSPYYYIIGYTNSGPYAATQPVEWVTLTAFDDFSDLSFASTTYGIDTNGVLQLPGPPVISQQPSNLTVLSGKTASFNLSVSGIGPFAYQWFFNTNTVPSNSTNNPFLVAPASSDKAGKYNVVVSNSYGNVTSSYVMLNVISPPQLSLGPVSNGLQISGLGVTGNNYLVQVATNLNPPIWITIATNMVGTNGVASYIDTNAPATGQKFYRLAFP